MLQLHIRTKKFGGWSGIESAAIQIGGDKLEVAIPGWIFLNNVNVTDSPPLTVGGYPFTVRSRNSQRYDMNFTGGQYIQFRRSYGRTFQVDVLGHGSDFYSSEGLCGNWTSETPNALVGRDHVNVYPLMPVQNAYGEEWQVNTLVGDPMLFNTTASAKCTYNSTGVCTAGAPACENQLVMANNACINVTQAENTQANCIFDVLTTGDVGAAYTFAYTDPIIGNPPEKCVERRNITDAIGCKGRGGQCVWRCDNTTHTCVDKFCQGPFGFEGCSCALPKTSAPTKAPVKVNITSAPTKAPIKVNITSAPTKAPVKVNITTAPTKAPVHGVCLNSTSWARCRVNSDPHFRTVRDSTPTIVIFI